MPPQPRRLRCAFAPLCVASPGADWRTCEALPGPYGTGLSRPADSETANRNAGEHEGRGGRPQGSPLRVVRFDELRTARKGRSSRELLGLSFAALTLIGGGVALADDPGIEEIVVRAEASVVASQGGIGSTAVVDAKAIELTRANHVHELLVRVPGVWISRGSGHEHLTAIRSGVLTGAGACGEFLLLENGIPIRPAGFCNVNNLFEVNTEQAAAVEVVRGPGSALFGGNALHGVINAITRTSAERTNAGFEAGPYDYLQLRLQGGSARWNVGALSTSSNGYRDATGYGQQKAYLGFTGKAGDWKVTNTLSATLLNPGNRWIRARLPGLRLDRENVESESGGVSGCVVDARRERLAAGDRQRPHHNGDAVRAALLDGVPAAFSSRTTLGEERPVERRRRAALRRRRKPTLGRRRRGGMVPCDALRTPSRTDARLGLLGGNKAGRDPLRLRCFGYDAGRVRRPGAGPRAGRRTRD